MDRYEPVVDCYFIMGRDRNLPDCGFDFRFEENLGTKRKGVPYAAGGVSPETSGAAIQTAGRRGLVATAIKKFTGKKLAAQTA